MQFPYHIIAKMFSFFDFTQKIFTTFSSRAFLALQEIPPAQPISNMKSKMDDLDAILKKYTSEVENHLHGATFVAVNGKGTLIYPVTKLLKSIELELIKSRRNSLFQGLWKPNF
jgi:hypothetical protein